MEIGSRSVSPPMEGAHATAGPQVATAPMPASNKQGGLLGGLGSMPARPREFSPKDFLTPRQQELHQLMRCPHLNIRINEQALNEADEAALNEAIAASLTQPNRDTTFANRSAEWREQSRWSAYSSSSSDSDTLFSGGSTCSSATSINRLSVGGQRVGESPNSTRSLLEVGVQANRKARLAKLKDECWGHSLWSADSSTSDLSETRFGENPNKLAPSACQLSAGSAAEALGNGTWLSIGREIQAHRDATLGKLTAKQPEQSRGSSDSSDVSSA
jgi:hypothetical protein